MRFGIGPPVTRKEDARFLTGQGRYVADIDFVRQAHAVLVFSPHAHARLHAVDKAAAEQIPGVYAILTGEDWAADGLGTLDPEVMAEDMGGPTGHRTKRPPLAGEDASDAELRNLELSFFPSRLRLTHDAAAKRPFSVNSACNSPAWNISRTMSQPPTNSPLT